MSEGEKKKGMTTSDKIALGSLIFAAIALFFTYKSWGIAKDAFKQSSKQFEVEHAPYLQIDSVKIFFDDSGYVFFTYRIQNLSANPAKIIDKRNSFAIMDKPPDSLPNDRQKDHNLFNQYVINESPLNPKYEPVHKRLGLSTMQQITDKKLFFFIYMEINYLNIATNAKRRYKCEMKISPIPGRPYAAVYYLTNDNEDIPD